jgi:hypothetical protein
VKPAVLSLALLVVASTVPAQGAEPEIPELMRVEGSAPWGTIVRVAEPEYPPALVAAKAKDVYMDVSGRVTFDGVLVDAMLTPASDDAKQMVEPLRTALRYWRFATPMDSRCQPAGHVVKNRVWFDFDGERPKLSITHTPGAAKPAATVKTVHRVDPTYPREMQRNGWQSWVYTRLKIDSRGNVTEVVAEAYPKQDNIDLRPFTKAAIRALEQWKFEPDEGTPVRQACWQVFFRLRD